MKKKYFFFIFLLCLLSSSVGFGQADLTITVTDGQAQYYPGQLLNYTITVQNLGTNDAANVVVQNAIPSGAISFNWTSSLGASGNNIAINDAIGTLTSGQTVTYNLSVEVASSATGDFSNEASVTSDTTDPDMTNNTSTDTDLQMNTADVVVNCSDNQMYYTGGESLIYNVTVTNYGPGVATNVVVSNPIPAGITYFSWTGSNGSYGINAPLNNTIASLAVGQTITYVITLEVPFSVSGDFTNQASATSSTFDPDMANNTSQDTDINSNSFVGNVAVSIVDNTSTYDQGGQITYTVTVVNYGPQISSNIDVLVPMPTGITSFSWTGNGNSGVNADLDDVITSLSPNETVVYTVVVDVPSGFTGDLVLDASANSTVMFDSETANNSAQDVNVQGNVADIVVTNTDNNTVYVPGTTNTYTITVTNNGPDDAVNVQIENLIPAGITGFSWTGTNGSTGADVDLVDTIPYLQVGQSVVYTVVLDVPVTFTGDLVSLVTMNSDSFDPDTTCVSCEDTDTMVTSGSDIVITNTNNQTEYTPGTTVVYTVTVTNNGPDATTNVNVFNGIPTGITNFSWTGSNGSSGTNTDLDDVIAALASGSTVTYTITLDIPVSYTGDLTSETTILSMDTVDPNPGCTDCIDTDAPVNTTGADLEVQLTDNATTYTPGTYITYTLTITNNGPEDAVDVNVLGGLPLNVTDIIWVDQNSVTGIGALNETIPLLANGATFTYQITIFVPSDYESNGNLINSVSVSSSTTDPDPDCTGCVDADMPNSLADIVTIKTNNQSNYTVGEDVSYVISITNYGPSDAYNVNVTDNQPSNTQMFWVNSLGGTGTGNINYLIPYLGVNEMVTFNVTLSVPENYNQNTNLTNTVSVTSQTTDPNPGCSACTDTDTPAPKTISVQQANNSNTATTYTVEELVNDVLIHSACAQVYNITSSPICGIGYFDSNNADFDFASGVILRNGNVIASQGAYTGTTMSSTCSGTGDGDLQTISDNNGNTGSINDVTYIQFDFTPLTDNFSFNFIFASNEYGQYQCGFSDVFAFILTDLTTGVSTNLAVIPGTNIPVSVTNIRDTAYNGSCPSSNSQYFDTYNVGIQIQS
ncbi:hypothetical protein DI487_09085 [Flavobacterium sediminis]|uniref:DUF11 domain-containing protein n=1 Tax=Flavobacterium sediminis TaxID=2201181 RepID=A0A2U8QVS6_9FLAO|nr:choice-of-anchor L domain-containing protein [Flavobacterium sediminis]AWM13994.1 hypothetical protein DI487_09085 [Flavobacterium sediminis]